MTTPEVNLQNESIFNRREVFAPSAYVSVYHQLRELKSLLAINKEGLKVGVRDQDEDFVHMKRRNALIDAYRPASLLAEGVTRRSIYAIPSLQDRSSMYGSKILELKID